MAVVQVATFRSGISLNRWLAAQRRPLEMAGRARKPERTAVVVDKATEAEVAGDNAGIEEGGQEGGLMGPGVLGTIGEHGLGPAWGIFICIAQITYYTLHLKKFLNYPPFFLSTPSLPFSSPSPPIGTSAPWPVSSSLLSTGPLPALPLAPSPPHSPASAFYGPWHSSSTVRSNRVKRYSVRSCLAERYSIRSYWAERCRKGSQCQRRRRWADAEK